MNIQNLLNQFLGAQTQSKHAPKQQGINSALNGLTGSLAGGATAGGIAALLVGNKKARKFAKKAATVGGAAVLGGLAFNAYQSWRQNSAQAPGEIPATALPANERSFQNAATNDNQFQLTLVKAMIAAAKADGHIDEVEEERIHTSIDNMQLSQELKATVFDLLRRPSTVQELAMEAQTMEQRTEVYLISCFAIDVDVPAEREHLNALKTVLGLPDDLARNLESQAVEINRPDVTAHSYVDSSVTTFRGR